VWRNALELDIELAAGAAPSSSPELALRTEQLLSLRRRIELARRVAEMARAMPDHGMSEELWSLAARVSHVDDDVVPVATASSLVQSNRFESMRAEQQPRPDEARLILRGGSPL
jgi:hypothetical protein